MQNQDTLFLYVGGDVDLLYIIVDVPIGCLQFLEVHMDFFTIWSSQRKKLE